ncbi:MAG: PaaI family thioesterase [Lentisphaerae bacterium]|nr:PaaI family thioesterase [Lentisphaerota bacterium]
MASNPHADTSAVPSTVSGTLPWSRSCFVCGEANPRGLHVRSRIENGAVVLEYTPRESDLGWRHAVHGGITMTLLDEVMTWAAIVAARRACVAAEVRVRFKRPVAVGQRLRVEGRIREAHGRLLVTDGFARDPDGRTLAMAKGKYMPMTGEQYRLCAEDFVSGEGALDPGAVMDGP